MLCIWFLLSSFLRLLEWNSKRDLPVGVSFSEVTRKQHPSQLAVRACIIPGCQKCSWRTNRQPVSSWSSSKNCQNHRCTRNHPPINLLSTVTTSKFMKNRKWYLDKGLVKKRIESEKVNVWIFLFLVKWISFGGHWSFSLLYCSIISRAK